MALTVGSPKSNKNSIFQKLPRLSTTIWLIIITAFLLIIAVPLLLSIFGEMSSQTLMRNQLSQLQTRYNDLQKQSGSQAALLTEINALKNDIDRAKLSYRNVSDSIEISKALIDLAWKNDITINGMAVSQGTEKIAGAEYPTLVYTLAMSGQVAAFQNYLLALGKELPSSQVTGVNIQPATMQGKLDKASFKISVLCNRQ